MRYVNLHLHSPSSPNLELQSFRARCQRRILGIRRESTSSQNMTLFSARTNLPDINEVTKWTPACSLWIRQTSSAKSSCCDVHGKCKWLEPQAGMTSSLLVQTSNVADCHLSA